MNLGLQGSGAHGAVAPGVCCIGVLYGVSAASARVLSVATLASGVAVGGQAGAKRVLAMLWRRLVDLAS